MESNIEDIKAQTAKVKAQIEELNANRSAMEARKQTAASELSQVSLSAQQPVSVYVSISVCVVALCASLFET